MSFFNSKVNTGGEQQFYKREIKINLAPPRREEHHQIINDDECNLAESKTVTTTKVVKPPPPQQTTVRSQIMTTSLLTLNQQPEVQEEVLLNLFSCNNSGSISSESSESLVEFESQQSKLKINEVVEHTRHEEKKQPESKRVIIKTNLNKNKLIKSLIIFKMNY